MDSSKTDGPIWQKPPVSTMLQKVHFSISTEGIKTLGILSEEKTEGKTTVALLLARGLKDVYNLKVLLVDLNTEGDPLLNEYYNTLELKDGITTNNPIGIDILRIKNLDIDWKKSLYDGLFINRIIESKKTDYDLIIVDSSAYAVSDMNIKIHTDTNIVVTSDKTFRSKTERFSLHAQLFKHLLLKEDITTNKKKVLGIIFNK